MRVNTEAFIVAVGLIVFNFLAWWWGSPYLMTEPNHPVVQQQAWDFANASTLVLGPFLLLLFVWIWPRQRS